MDRYTWIKLYTEILDDPKMGRLPNHLWRRAIELFLLAGKNGNGGALQPVEEMAWTLRLDKVKMLEDLHGLAEVGVVQEAQPDQWVVVNFAKRQAALTDAERKKKQRSGVDKPPSGKSHAKEETVSQECHENVTEEEEEEEKESTTATTTGAPSEKMNVFKMFSDNFGSLGPVTTDVLIDMEKTYSEEWALAAMTEAVMSNARNLKYVETILRRWKAEGFQSQKQKPVSVPRQPARGGGTKQTAAQAQIELSDWLKEKEASGVNIN
jgi:DnaD/phage-associated family protein